MRIVLDIIWKTLNEFVTFVGAIWVLIEIVGNFNPDVQKMQTGV